MHTPHKTPEDDLKSTLASIGGNILEWYDFAIYGYFSDIIGRNFFPPKQDGSSSIIESFLVFGGAFFVRPVGGIVMGYIGDTFSRKRALEISIFLMAFPTFAMGCLPPFERLGWWSLLMLVCVRMLQGLSVGGQLMSSLVFVVEGHDRKNWGWYGSFAMTAASTLLGEVVGVSCCSIMHFLFCFHTSIWSLLELYLF
jgi:MHS family proline/betaine transporter-like MFS transporter